MRSTSGDSRPPRPAQSRAAEEGEEPLDRPAVPRRPAAGRFGLFPGQDLLRRCGLARTSSPSVPNVASVDATRPFSTA